MRANEIKNLIGLVVAVEWLDPCLNRLDGDPPPSGKVGLAVQLDIGVLTDYTEGVLRVCHTFETHPLGSRREGYASYIVGKLVRTIRSFGSLDGGID
jgi:hypothetical protein